jgi:putative peptide zinc metalloprotease protein
VIGVGIYLVWPSFFTNVTDSYRLSRAGRLRTDLGGVYFNAVFIVARELPEFPAARSPGDRPAPLWRWATDEVYAP